MAKFSKEQIDYLMQYPSVFRYVTENRLSWNFEFREYVWKISNGHPSNSHVRQAILEFTNDSNIFRVISCNEIYDFKYALTKHGKPTRARNSKKGEYDYRKDKGDTAYLLQTGYFQKSRGGISPTSELMKILIIKTSEEKIESVLQNIGIDPSKIGYGRLSQLKVKIKNITNGPISSQTNYSPEILEIFKKNPFIKSATSKQVRFTNAFYQAAALFYSAYPFQKLLKLFDLDISYFPAGFLASIRYKISTTKIENSILNIDLPDEKKLDLLRAYEQILYQKVIDTFRFIGNNMPSFSCEQKKSAVLMIQRTAQVDGAMPLKQILELCHLSRSTYYGILSNPDYGQKQSQKQVQDEKDIQIIKAVMESEGFQKGSRQIQMQIKQRYGLTMNRKKILRLMNAAGLKCTLRQSTPAKRIKKEELKKLVKPNLLKRRFRLARPNQIFLTDVSYLDYESDKRAYLSTVKDPVSGKIINCVVSDTQDLLLAQETIKPLPYNEGAIFHSDQGYLYMNPNFQDMIAQKGMRQSMSRRGNCWDNASQESFFGHFKDECPYQQCSSLEELKGLVSDYVEYYNYRRPQRCRKNMTPVEYEAYIMGMNEEEFSLYLSQEEDRFQKMKEKAVKDAIQRARIDRDL